MDERVDDAGAEDKTEDSCSLRMSNDLAKAKINWQTGFPFYISGGQFEQVSFFFSFVCPFYIDY